MARAGDILARSQPRRGLRRHAAAIYVGVSVTKFDQWVHDGVMPKPFRKDGVVLWDIFDLDISFEAMKFAVTEDNPFDQLVG